MADSLNDYGYNKTADATSLNNASLTGFPMFVRLEQGTDTTGTGAGGLDPNASIDGVEDFGFFNENGTALDFYAVTIDHTNGIYEFWVRTDLVRDGTTDIQVGYGSGSTDDTVTEATLWDSVTGLISRWGWNGDFTDSTSNNNDATAYGNASLVNSGPFGAGVSTDGSGDYLKITDSNGNTPAEMTVDNQDHTLIGFYRKDESLGTGSGNRRRLWYREEWGPGAWISGDTLRVHNAVQGGGRGEYADYSWNQDQSLHMMGQTFDNSTTTTDAIFDGGIYGGTKNSFTRDTADDGFWIGWDGNNSGEELDGLIGEFQIYGEIKSENWTQSIQDMSSIGGYSLLSWNASEPTRVTVTDTVTTATSTSTAGIANETGTATITSTTATSTTTATETGTQVIWKTPAAIAYGQHQYGALQPFGVIRDLATTATATSTAYTAQETGKTIAQAVTATTQSSAKTAQFTNMVLTDTGVTATSTSAAGTADVYLYGIPGELSVYIEGQRFTNFTDINIEERKNEINTFEFKAYVSSNEDRQFIQEGKEVLIFEGTDFLFKGQLTDVEYDSTFKAKCEGDGMEIKLLNRKTNRDTYNNVAGDQVVKTEVPTTIMPYGTIETAPVTSLRFDHDNKARAVAGAANAVGFDWYISHERGDEFQEDYLNFVEEMGRDTVQETFTIGENAQLVERDKDDGFIANDLTLLGRGDGVNQLEARIYAATTRFTQLDGGLAQAETGSFTVDDTSNFGAAGDNVLLRVGSEVVDATITDGTTLSINGRALNAYDGEETQQIKHQDRITVWLRENTTQGIGPFTAESRTIAEAGSSIDSYGIREDRSTDKTIVDLSTLEKVADRELRNRFEDIFRVQVTPVDPRITKGLEIGDTVVAEDLTAMDVSDEFEIVGMDIERRSTGEGTTLHLSNRPRRLTERLSNIERDRDTLNAHMQGATNIDSQSFSDNCDASHPLDNSLYIPSDVVKVNKLRLTFKRESFRGYVQNSSHSHTVSINLPSHTHDLPEIIDDVYLTWKSLKYTGPPADGVADDSHIHEMITSGSQWRAELDTYGLNNNVKTVEGGGGVSTSETSDNAGSPSYGIYEPGSEPDVDVDIIVDDTVVDTVANVSVGDELTQELELKTDLDDPVAGEYHDIALVPKDTGGGDNGRCRLQADVFAKVFIESTL